MKIGRWVVAVALLGGLLAMLPLTAQQKNTAPPSSASISARPIPVSVTSAQASDGYQIERQFSGVLTAKRQSELSFVRKGLLQDVLYDEGEQVTQGQAVARLDTRELQARRQRLQAQLDRSQARLAELKSGPRNEPRRGAEADVRRLASELDLARTKQSRRQHLYSEGAIPQEDLDEWNSQVRGLEESLEAARQSSLELENGTRPEVIEQAQAEVAAAQADLTSLQVEIEDSVISAPFSGRVLSRQLDEGSVVSAGDPVLTLGETSSLEARISLPQEQAFPNSIQLDLAGKKIPATLIGAVPQIEQASNTKVVRYQVKNHGLPGQPVTLNLKESVAEAGFWLPTTCLTSAGNGLWQCYTVSPDDLVQTQSLELLHRETDRVLVRGTLKSGDRVITEGIGQVVPGQHVSTRPAGQD